MTHNIILMRKACLLMLISAFLVTVAIVPDGLCYPPAGSDYMGNTIATITLQIYGPYGFTETLTVRGPTWVNRSDQYDPGDGRMKIDTEIISMSLTGNSNYIGNITVIESPVNASTGAIRQQIAGQDFPADSFFDVYIEIQTNFSYPLRALHNNDPKHMTAVIYRIPPYGSTYENPETIFLYDENDSLVGAMLATHHKVGFPGDINGDGAVDIYDAILLAAAFGSRPGEPRWNPYADLKPDGVIDIFDAIILASNFGKVDP